MPELHADARQARPDRSRCRDRGHPQSHGRSAGGTGSRRVRDVRPIARAIAEGLAADERLRALPAKFGLLVDGGGAVSIAAERADIALLAVDAEIALGIDTPSGTQWLGVTSPDAAAAAALAAVRAFLEAAGRQRASACAAFRPTALRMSGRFCAAAAAVPGRAAENGTCARGIGTAAGVAAPFGRLEAEQLRDLAALAEAAGAAELRLSPWRTVYFGARDAAAAATDRGGRALRRPDRRRGRPAAADRGLSWRARLQVEQRRCARRRATAGGAGLGSRLRRQHSCLGLRQGLCTVRPVQAGAGRQGRALSPGAQRHDARSGRAHHWHG